ncbi:hypothetical protein E2C01_091053 [Portunus trituberculatus]|uniref:Uncharacterized protein n=1 Tax=Portunus trituberculatus TaxID=210409 RepID=A0A5B7JMI8_PORTR|nr:hypothetical protein [Portunus trituberculatus]
MARLYYFSVSQNSSTTITITIINSQFTTSHHTSPPRPLHMSQSPSQVPKPSPHHPDLFPPYPPTPNTTTITSPARSL